jgi:outer membrane biosynthesis protein TonB
MTSRLGMGTRVLFLVVGPWFAETGLGQAPDRAANDNSAAQSTRDSQQSSGTDENVYEVGHGVTPSHPIYTPNPEYTDRARKKKIPGTILVALVLTAEGKPRDVTVKKN